MGLDGDIMTVGGGTVESLNVTLRFENCYTYIQDNYLQK